MRRSERAGRHCGRWPAGPPGPPGQHERGFVTAETAVATLSLALVLAVLLWGAVAAVAYIRCVDAAWTGARAAARSEPPARVLAAARSAAPVGARVTVRRDGDLVRVGVEARQGGPGPLAVGVRAAAVALAEERTANRAGGTGGWRAGQGESS